jgi:hypothetical protein
MNRRSFFGAILGVVVTPTLVGGDNTIGMFSWLWNKLFRRKAKEERQQLAQAMVEPLRRQLDYQSLARKVLCVEEFPAQIPLGWKLCDGTNGTPELRTSQPKLLRVVFYYRDQI